MGLFAPAAASAAPLYYMADAQSDACETIGDISPTSVSSNCTNPSGKGVNGLIATLLNVLSIIAGVVAVIMLMIAGFKYITSQGDSAQLSSAKNALIYVIVGLIIVVASQAIVKFVLRRTTVPAEPAPRSSLHLPHLTAQIPRDISYAKK